MGLAGRFLYNLLLPVFCVLAAPAWLLKMARRGGLSSRLWERMGFYDRAPEFEPGGVVYVHAVSVGEVLVALKLIARWRNDDPAEKFVLAATTSTGFQVASSRAPDEVRVIYSPIDLPFLIRRLFARFEPRVIAMVDSELWPNMLHAAERRGIPCALVNARLSPCSARRYRRFKPITGRLLGLLKLVCVQAEEHTAAWRAIGVTKEAVVVTGSVKFDPEGAKEPLPRPDFGDMLKEFGAGRPVVLAASTHRGEEVFVAEALKDLPAVLPVLLPRHAERRADVKAELERAGFEVVLRSRFAAPQDLTRAVLVVDSTGELRDWTAHADLVVIGKSLLAQGGQNPTEAIAARVPVVCGPAMQNFEPLITELRDARAVATVQNADELRATVERLLGRARERTAMVEQATAVLVRHEGATARTCALLRRLASAP